MHKYGLRISILHNNIIESYNGMLYILFIIFGRFRYLKRFIYLYKSSRMYIYIYIYIYILYL